MKRTIKLLSSLLIALAMIFSNFLPFIPVYAEETIRLQLDGTTVSGDIITFQNGEISASVTVIGTGFSFDGNNLLFDLSDLNNVKLALGDGFDRNCMELKLHDGQTLTITGDNEVIFDGLDFSQDNSPHLGLYVNNQSDPNNDPSGPELNSTATINYSVDGVIEYDEGPFDGLGVSFAINDAPYRPDDSKIAYSEGPAYERDEQGQLILNDDGNPIEIKDPETMEPLTEIAGVAVVGDSINYHAEGDQVDFVFMMNPGTLMTSLTINGELISDLPSTREELIAYYTDHRMEIPVKGIAKADTYNVVVEARYPNSDEEFMGNFLWDYNPEGYTSPEDKILHATLTFVQAEYNGRVYSTEEEINTLGGVYIWNDAERKDNYTEEREGCGEAQFPVGTKLTVKIIPDAGYQLVNFGINGGVFEPQEEIGTYQFTVQGGPSHLQASIEQVDNMVNTASEKISAGDISLGDEQSMAIGTARLDVKDIRLTSEQISNFRVAAEGYDIKNYLDISLFNTVFKGDESESWDTQVTELDNEATIWLQLADDVNGEEIVIVHEKHDGTYEIIPTEYLPEYNAIVFTTKSFSNYAIATRPNVTTPNTGAFVKNAAAALPMLTSSGILMLGLALILKRKLVK